MPTSSSGASPASGRTEFRRFAEVDSTNDIALKLAAGGAPEGTVVIADAQRAGRGRRGREWFSPPEAGLYVSCIVRWSPGPSGPGISILTLAAGVAVARAIETTTALPVELKWPNDIVVGRPWRKLGGILCEATGSGPQVDAVVVGMGVNLRAAAYPPELAGVATSIEVELGRPIDRESLAVACVDLLLANVQRLRAGDAEHVLKDWRDFGRASLANTSVRWIDHERERRGRTRDIAADGALIVDTGGALERIVAGEVTWDRTS